MDKIAIFLAVLPAIGLIIRLFEMTISDTDTAIMWESVKEAPILETEYDTSINIFDDYCNQQAIEADMRYRACARVALFQFLFRK